MVVLDSYLQYLFKTYCEVMNFGEDSLLLRVWWLMGKCGAGKPDISRFSLIRPIMNQQRVGTFALCFLCGKKVAN